jgi:nitrogen regulatory protein PII
MHYKLIIGLIPDELSDAVLDAARHAGATGSTIINNARGEGAEPHKTFFGLELTSQTDVMLFLVDPAHADDVLSAISEAGKIGEQKGSGIAFQLDVEKAVGV